jgi:ribonuclease T2
VLIVALVVCGKLPPMPKILMRSWKWILAAFLLLPQGGCADSARFDYYLLALSVAPAFCEDQPERKKSYAQCRNLTAPAFRAVPLTLHGLWPNRLDRRHPAYCQGESRGAFCSLPPLSLTPPTRAQLDKVMPGSADCLERYQWVKHGSCTGMPVEAYYKASAELTERVNRAIGGDISRHMGRAVSLVELRAALSRADPELLDAVSFDCRTPRTPDPAKRRPMLHEVRVYFQIDPGSGGPGRPMPYTRAGVRHYNSGCPGGLAYVDTPLD